MAISPKWFTEKRLFLHEAAALWNDCEPSSDEYAPPNHCPNFQATKEMLLSAARLGDLPWLSEPYPGSRHPLICVAVFTRADLVVFAKAMGQWPRFLFDLGAPADQPSHLDFLIDAMTRSPDPGGPTKAYWRNIAVVRFGLTARQFELDWHIALKRTGAKWFAPGRRKKMSA